MAEKALTVTALTKYIKLKFDSDVHLKDLLLEGEISNFKHNVRGHFYFTLKDDKASISAVMFKSHAWKVPFTPKDGMKVLVRGYISIFEAAGSYQVYVDSMQETGLGNLYQAYLELKDKLEKAGYFDARHKKTLPPFPRQVAVITSKTGAAVRDIIHIIGRRYPLTKILVYPTTVQGEQAQYEIVENIRKADENPENDVMIVGRGGGSIEDLWAFNEAMVAEAIFNAKTPIVSAVGHETDFTIADFVADVRAPTPSGAAELVVPDQKTLLRDIESSRNRLREATFRILTQQEKALNNLTARYVFRDPARIAMIYARPLEHLLEKLTLTHPRQKMVRMQARIEEKEKQLHRAYDWVIRRRRDQLQATQAHLSYANPLSIMEKGYTLVDHAGRYLKSVQDVEVGMHIRLRFKDGVAEAKILDKSKERDENV
ncbi:MAG: exodeoxyribonuclease VII large subunit [Acholeplasmatales bacterium]|nr:MAG: exodeoxyribonuclease VII large subunit [Acholeplasmatales bacterium]